MCVLGELGKLGRPEHPISNDIVSLESRTDVDSTESDGKLLFGAQGATS